MQQMLIYVGIAAHGSGRFTEMLKTQWTEGHLANRGETKTGPVTLTDNIRYVNLTMNPFCVRTASALPKPVFVTSDGGVAGVEMRISFWVGVGCLVYLD